jgi:hypothetical protein
MRGTASALSAARPAGRPSNAALTLEARTLRAALADVTEDRDDVADELIAYVNERRRVAAELLSIARQGQRAIALGWRPTQALQELERLAHREQLRAGAMTAGEEE